MEVIMIARRNSLRRLFLIALGGILVTILLAGSPGRVLADHDDQFLAFSLVYEEPQELVLGKAGIVVTKSYYNAVGVIGRVQPSPDYPQDDLDFADRWVDYHIFDYLGRPYTVFYGLNYVYFELMEQTQTDWEEGVLSIYYLNPASNQWEVCPTFFVDGKGKQKDRVTCVMPGFGLYGLAEEQ
jgi:hypothetical protein